MTSQNTYTFDTLTFPAIFSPGEPRDFYGFTASGDEYFKSFSITPSLTTGIQGITHVKVGTLPDAASTLPLLSGGLTGLLGIRRRMTRG